MPAGFFLAKKSVFPVRKTRFFVRKIHREQKRTEEERREEKRREEDSRTEKKRGEQGF